MDLVGTWLRQLMRAGTAAAIVPVALLAALLVIVLGSGGLGGLDSLGQLVAGPAVPQMDAASPSAAENVRVAPVDPGGRDVAPARSTQSASSRRSTGARAAAPATGARVPPRRTQTRVAPAPGGSSAPVVPAPPEPDAPSLERVAPPPPPPPPSSAGSQPPAQLAEVVGSTVNAVGVGLQTLIDELLQALGRPPAR